MPGAAIAAAFGAAILAAAVRKGGMSSAAGITMRVLIVNPPHPSIGSRIPREQLPPLGLLYVGGSLVDAGHEVRLLDAEFGPMSLEAIVRHSVAYQPQALLLGHSGSTSSDPVIAALSGALRAVLPSAFIVYGGVFPTYHWREVLAEQPQIDVVARGEGEQTAPRSSAEKLLCSPASSRRSAAGIFRREGCDRRRDTGRA